MHPWIILCMLIYKVFRIHNPSKKLPFWLYLRWPAGGRRSLCSFSIPTWKCALYSKCFREVSSFVCFVCLEIVQSYFTFLDVLLYKTSLYTSQNCLHKLQQVHTAATRAHSQGRHHWPHILLETVASVQVSSIHHLFPGLLKKSVNSEKYPAVHIKKI